VPLSFDAYEKLAIERALREAGDNVDEAARLLEVGLSTFYRKMKKHRIPPPRSARERVRGPEKELEAD
jgi:excisionase family DNA binding protein